MGFAAPISQMGRLKKRNQWFAWGSPGAGGEWEPGLSSHLSSSRGNLPQATVPTCPCVPGMPCSCQVRQPLAFLLCSAPKSSPTSPPGAKPLWLGKCNAPLMLLGKGWEQPHPVNEWRGNWQGTNRALKDNLNCICRVNSSPFLFHVQLQPLGKRLVCVTVLLSSEAQGGFLGSPAQGQHDGRHAAP